MITVGRRPFDSGQTPRGRRRVEWTLLAGENFKKPCCRPEATAGPLIRIRETYHAIVSLRMWLQRYSGAAAFAMFEGASSQIRGGDSSTDFIIFLRRSRFAAQRTSYCHTYRRLPEALRSDSCLSHMCLHISTIEPRLPRKIRASINQGSKSSRVAIATPQENNTRTRRR
jgi:hypothetical protein